MKPNYVTTDQLHKMEIYEAKKVSRRSGQTVVITVDFQPTKERILLLFADYTTVRVEEWPETKGVVACDGEFRLLFLYSEGEPLKIYPDSDLEESL